MGLCHKFHVEPHVVVCSEAERGSIIAEGERREKRHVRGRIAHVVAVVGQDNEPDSRIGHRVMELG